MDYFIKHRHLTHSCNPPDPLPYLTAIDTTIHNRAFFSHSHHTMPLCHGRLGLNPLFFRPTSEYTSEGVQ